MKNMKKLVALFAATVMTMSLSVSAFAATVETTVGADDANIADEAFNLVFTAPTGGETDVDQLTMIAYLVPNTTTLETWVPYDGTQTIVAINQVGGDVGFGSVPVDVAKLTAGNSIAVAIGGTDVGTTAKYLVTYTTAPQTVSYTVVYNLANGTAEGNPEASNSDETIAEFFAKVTAEPEKDGFTFKHWSKTENGDAINTASPDKMSTLLDDPAGTTVTLYAVYEAEESEPVIIVIGDVNGDGKANGTDAGIIKVYASKYTANAKATVNTNNGATVGAVRVKEDGTEVVVGDVNGDGKANGTDAGIIKVYASKYTANAKATVNTNNGSTVGAEVSVVAD